ncbi:hypothetical protein cand_029890 [Cryptosporidium andersoni]|uniref:Exportin-T n=1 Tax=Cryptosporidium andersoni TaxID=117008 RepID=A0A1J4MNJ3_9CRYT|nr:hypothetical protein cand_029890 [Cryptosporidium andersoni]
MDDLEKAILAISSPSTSSSDKLKALEICNSAIFSNNGWQICLQYFILKEQVDVRFWCLGSLVKIVEANKTNTSLEKSFNIGEEERTSLRDSIIQYLKEGMSKRDEPKYIRTRLAELYVNLMYIDYPEKWPSAVYDFASLVTLREWMPDMFIRILNAFDKIIVNGDNIQNSSDLNIRRNIKDKMRENGDITLIFNTWGLVVTKFDSLTTSYIGVDILSRSLTVMQSFINWIDISYAINKDVLNIIFHLLDPEKSPVVAEALDFIASIFMKGMMPNIKIKLFLDMHIVELIQSHMSLDISNITTQRFSSSVAPKWDLIQNCDVITAIERDPCKNSYKSFCSFLLSLRARCILRLLNELFQSTKALAKELKTNNLPNRTGYLETFSQALSLFELLIPILSEILVINDLNFFDVKSDACRLLNSFFSSLKSDIHINGLSVKWYSQVFLRPFLYKLLFNVLKVSERSEKFYYYRNDSSEISPELEEDISSNILNTPKLSDVGMLFLSILELDSGLVSNFMEMIIEQILSGIQSLSFSQVDSVLFLLSKFGFAILTERKRHSRVRNVLNSQKYTELNTTLADRYTKFVSEILNYPPIIGFSCNCKDPGQNGLHPEIFFRRSLSSIFRYFYEILDLPINTFSLTNHQINRDIGRIIDIFLSEYGFLNHHPTISLDASKDILQITRLYSGLPTELYTKYIDALQSHKVLRGIFSFVDNLYKSNLQVQTAEGHLHSKSLTILCEALGHLLYNSFKVQNSNVDKQHITEKYEDMIKSLLACAMRLLEYTPSTGPLIKQYLINWQYSMEIIYMIVCIADGMAESTPYLKHMWDATLNIIILLLSKPHIGFINNRWQLPVLAPVHRLARSISTEIFKHLGLLCEAYLKPFLDLKIHPKELENGDNFGSQLLNACEEISQLLCHIILMYNGCEKLSDFLSSCFPMIFSSMLQLWYKCWPIELKNSSLLFPISLYQELIFSENYHHYRYGIQMAILKIICAISRNNSSIKVLFFLLLDTSSFKSARNILENIILDPINVTFPQSMRTYSNIPQEIFAYRRLLFEIESPLLIFIVISLLSTLGTPAQWVIPIYTDSQSKEYTLTAYLNDCQRTAFEILIRIYTVFLEKYNSLNLKVELRNILTKKLEILMIFIWFSILDTDIDDINILESQLKLLSLLVRGLDTQYILNRESIRNNLNNIRTEDINEVTEFISSEAISEIRRLVILGTNIALSPTGRSNLNDLPSEVASFIKRCVTIFRGYHYYTTVISSPISGFINEALFFLSNATNKDTVSVETLKSFVERFQCYVKQVLSI